MKAPSILITLLILLTTSHAWKQYIQQATHTQKAKLLNSDFYKTISHYVKTADKVTDKYQSARFLKMHAASVAQTLLWIEMGREIYLGDGPLYFRKTPEHRILMKKRSPHNKLKKFLKDKNWIKKDETDVEEDWLMKGMDIKPGEEILR